MSVKQLAKYLGQAVEQLGSENQLALHLRTSTQRIRHLAGKDQGKGKLITQVDLVLLRRLQHLLRVSNEKFWGAITSELDAIINAQNDKFTAAGKDQRPATNRPQRLPR